ncbi:MAG: hypothetical protein ACTHMY_01585, partial [Solirubrobacteraceae bacterium]
MRAGQRQLWPPTVGDEIRAERSVWRVLRVDAGRYVCQLLGGSRVIHHFRRRQIEAVISRAAESDSLFDPAA